MIAFLRRGAQRLMRNRLIFLVSAWIVGFSFSFALPAQTIASAKAASFDSHDLSGKWNRVSPFQTYSNVPGGANELQAYILGQAKAPRKLDVPTEEAPFTPEGKAKFDKNIPGYGKRITAPMLGNDPQSNCDPWGVPRMLNGQVAGPHSNLEILQVPKRTYVFSEWHHDYRIVYTDGRQLPKLDENLEPKWNGY